MKKFLLFIFVTVLLAPSLVLAHPGRTDAYGCHTCRTNCTSWGLSTGEYHCHNAKALPQPEEPIKSTYGANGTGSTRPAPEYAAPAVKTVQPQKKQAPAVPTSPQKQKAPETPTTPVQPEPVKPTVVEVPVVRKETVKKVVWYKRLWGALVK